MSQVSIWNLALSHVGNAANVSSPNEQSREAELCRQFYPVALRTSLEVYPWSFATARQTLSVAEEEPWNSWRFAYTYPADALTLWAVVSPDATDDVVSLSYDSPLFQQGPQANFPSPKNFEVETDADGARIVLSSVEDAVGRYTRIVSDTSLFSGTFTDAVGWLLASYLSGPILRGETGRAEGRRLLEEAKLAISAATAHDGRQRRSTDFRQAHTPSFLAARG